jgi:UDPglucose--hexose-1-phosphate uridylyltransferase
MIYESVQKLINYSIKGRIITQDDEFVVRNYLMEVLHLTSWSEPGEVSSEQTIDEILDEITDYACQNGIIEDTAAYRDLFDTKIMGVVTPMPREVICWFNQRYVESPQAATDWYYDFSKKLNYVRAGRIAKDLKWTYQSEYGLLDITINRSKPEKDPRDIAAAKSAPSSAYPKCQLCPENAGFAGHLTHPARQNLRPIPISVHGEKWQFQYSPYGYYNEHCIVFNEKHIPMKIDAAVFEKLFDILESLPHYFVGSNADLPIVGGSILSHEHFQGGHYTFAMEKAPVEKNFIMPEFHHVHAGIVKWPMSVIRLRSQDRVMLAKACTEILDKWRSYSDPDAGIFAETDGIPHNTITPIARMDGNYYECDLVLRNNITTSERPLGVFHPNPSLHHIKKENIGLIEVMGLAVLPSRLANELEVLKNGMLSGADLSADSATASHAEWAKDVLARHPEFSAENAEQILHDEVGAVFEQVLLDAGVFKRDDAGMQAFGRFIATLTDGGAE